MSHGVVAIIRNGTSLVTGFAGLRAYATLLTAAG